MKYKAVIFDMDGTLLETIYDLQDNLNYTFKSLGLNGDFTRREMETFLGSGKKVQILRALSARNYSHNLLPQIDRKLSEVYAENISNKTHPYEGMLEVLEKLAKNNIIALCLTNKPHFVALEVADHYFGKLLIDTRGDKGDGITKPNPLMLNEFMKKHGLSKEEVLYVGDSDIDMATANNSEIDNVFVTYGYCRLEEVSNFNIKYIANHPLDILKFLSIV